MYQGSEVPGCLLLIFFLLFFVFCLHFHAPEPARRQQWSRAGSVGSDGSRLCSSPAATYDVAWQLPPAIKHACVQADRSMVKHQEGGSRLLFFQQRGRICVLLSALIRNVEFLLFGLMSFLGFNSPCMRNSRHCLQQL